MHAPCDEGRNRCDGLHIGRARLAGDRLFRHGGFAQRLIFLQRDNTQSSARHGAQVECLTQVKLPPYALRETERIEVRSAMNAPPLIVLVAAWMLGCASEPNGAQ